jgi:class I fructose-bisphosphate aldolase
MESRGAVDPRTGKRIRLGRLFGPDGKTIIVAYSHGLLLGPLPGMQSKTEMVRTVESLCAADGIMISPGMVLPLENAFVGQGRPSLVIHLDWTNFSRGILPYEQGVQVSIASIEEVAAAGADAVMTYLLVGNDDPELEAREIARNAAVARACERAGIVHMIEPRSSQERRAPASRTDLEIMRLYTRIAAEIGADIVKCIWSGSVESMTAIVEACPAPILVAGGARTADPGEAVVLARQAASVGCSGLVFGRNVYQADDPPGMLRALRHALESAS